MTRVYLDYNATAPLRAEARAAMISAMDVCGNPSSVHAEGRAAKALVERARSQVATAFGCKPQQVVFTSGATEAAATVLAQGWRRVFATPVEHDCIDAHREHFESWNDIPLDRGGLVTPATLQELGVGPGDLCIVQAANSETGVTQALFGTPGYSAGAAVLCDAVQYAGKAPLAINWQPPQFTLLSGHKFGGPKGVGALILPETTDLKSIIRGGGQEMGRRSGTENVTAICGFGAAAEASEKDLSNGVWERVAELRNILENTIEAEAKNTIFVGKGGPRLANTSCMITPGWNGATQVMQMDLAGYAVSAGSACSSGKVRASRVLRAMGFGAVDAESAIRVSLGPETAKADVLRFADAWLAAEKKFRAKAA